MTAGGAGALLGYRTVKPHAADGSDCCARRGPGHHACQNPACPGATENNGAGRAAGPQTRRHATTAEYAALPPGLTPIDGVCHQAVFMCDDCADTVDEICDHPPIPAPPCPACAAAGDDPCLEKDGKTPRRRGWHTGRQGPSMDPCRHAHRDTCPVFADCACTGDDPPPARPTRTVADGPGPDVSRLLIPPPAARLLLAEHGIGWERVREVASVRTQDNRPAIRAQAARTDDAGNPVRDEHGHEVLDEVVIVIEKPPGTP